MSAQTRNKSGRDDATSDSISVSRRTALLGAGGAAAAGVLAGASQRIAATELRSLQATPATEMVERTLQLVYSFEAQFTGYVPVGLTPRGVRLDLPYSGEVVEGPFAGAAVQGTDYLLLRPDGVGVMDVRNAISTADGQHIAAEVRGYVFMPEGVELPPPDVMLAPDFVWPEMEVTLHGFGMYETGAADLAWFNRTVLVIGGVANLGAGTLFATAHALDPIPELPTG